MSVTFILQNYFIDSEIIARMPVSVKFDIAEAAAFGISQRLQAAQLCVRP